MKNIFVIVIFFLGLSIQAQEKQTIENQEVEEQTEEEGQSRDSQAMDATATQWSFQMAYQLMPDYFDDIVNGSERSGKGRRSSSDS